MAIDANYAVNMEDEQFKQVDKDITQTKNDLMNTYGGMIDSANKYYDDLAQNAQDWADKQTQLQQERTDFAIEQIEQQKDKAHKDYVKEQSGAYQDWRKQSNRYGVEAEKMASAGLDKTGFSESSQVSMYNTYQNRVATARESYNNAVLNYNNAIKDAQLQNNATLAEIAYNALQQQLELSLEGFQYKNQLILEQANKKLELDNIKWSRYQDILQQINTENALKAEIDMHNDTQKWQTEENKLDREHDKTMANLNHELQLARDEINNKFEEKLEGIKHDYNIKYLNAKTEKDKELAKQEHDLKMKQLAQEKADAIAKINAEYAAKVKAEKELIDYETENRVYIGGGGGSSGGTGKIKTYTDAKAAGKAKALPTFSNKKQAVDYLRKNYNVPNANGLYTFEEWSRKKNADSPSALIKNSSSYGEYLQLHCEYLIDQYAR